MRRGCRGWNSVWRWVGVLWLMAWPWPTRADPIIIQAVGDVMLAGPWTPQLRKLGYRRVFDGVAAELALGHLNVANLESPIAEGGVEFVDKRFRFRAEPAVAGALRAAEFHLVNLANNHTMDFGERALAETLLNLRRAGVSWFGAGGDLAAARKPMIFNIATPGRPAGRRVAFLGYSSVLPADFFATPQRAGVAPARPDRMVEDVRLARRLADVVIVSLHWGAEAQSEVQAFQREWAHQLVDAGADVILGHHPHVLRGIERYRHGLIVYSLGNFAFASRSAIADVSVLVRLYLDGPVRWAELVPIDVLHARVGFQPQVLRGRAGLAVALRLHRLSEPLGTPVYQTREGRYFVNFSQPPAASAPQALGR